MEPLLEELVSRLKEAYAADLISVILYGSAAASDHHSQHSDYNVLCALRRVGLADLRRGQKAIQWWTKKKQPAPLLLSMEEIRCSDDVFPIEYLDVQQAHRVLYGEDPYAHIEVNRANHRQQVEHELSSNLLRLRQRYLVLHPSDKDVIQLMVRSIASFATLARHALILTGAAAPVRKREVFQAAAACFGVDASPFEAVLDIRESKRKAPDAHALFSSYLDQITKLQEVVDKL